MLDIIIINLIVAVFVVSFLLRSIHIYQLEAYEFKKMQLWLRANCTYLLTRYLFFYCAVFFVSSLCYLFLSGILFSLYFYILQLPLFFIIAIYEYILENKDYKKPLIFTKRVIRFICIFACIYFVVFNILIYFIPLKIMQCILPLSFILFGFSFFISHCISVVIEKIIANMYIKSAIKKLENSNITKTIGITGSFGKTSVKNFLHVILEEKYFTLATPFSYNTPMGIVKTVRDNLRHQHKVFIVEMGADKSSDIKNLCEIVSPNIGVLTSIDKQHLSSFKTIENIVKTKNELTNFIASSHGVMVFNLDDLRVFGAFEKFSFSKYGVCINIDKHFNFNYFGKKTTIISASNLTLSDKGSKFDVLKNRKHLITVQTKVLGEHNILNILMAIAVALELKVEKENLISGIKKIKPVPHRLQIKKLKNGATLIDNGFNSNPVSAKISLNVLSLFENKTKIVITPGLVELASEQYTENYLFAKNIAEVADVAVVVNHVNKSALYAGLKDGGMKKESIMFFENFNKDLISYLNTLNPSSVALIENDLPDNYK